MTIRLSDGNIFEEDVDAIVNPVNCVGVMGNGLAEKFKQRFPGSFTTYKNACNAGAVRPGKILVYETKLQTNPKFIFHFPTKDHWRNPSRLKYIDDGLIDLLVVMISCNIYSIAIPALGCGEGGLSWVDVEPRIRFTLNCLPEIDAVIFPPQRKP